MSPAPSSPPPDLWTIVREWGGPTILIAAGGWLLRQVREWRRRQERHAELIEAIAEQCRVSADLERFRFEYLAGRTVEDYLDGEAHTRWERRGSNGQSPRQQYETLKSRIHETRDRLWRARGYPEAPRDPDALSEEERQWREMVLREIRQTKRWQVADSKPKTTNTEGA
jgi:hypothetical protein